jgi:hypothetical protein
VDPIALRIACGVVLAATLLAVVWRLYRDEINHITDDAQWAEFWHERIMDESDDGRGP